MPIIKNLDFKNLDTEFLNTKGGLKVRNFKLEAKDLSLASSLDITKTIKGDLWLRIYGDLLKDSPQFKSLLSFLHYRANYIDFKFRIGGLLKAPRFLWLKTDFKQALQQVISKPRQKILEDQLNDIIEHLFD